MHHVLELSQSNWLNFTQKKTIEATKENGDKDEKALCKVKDNAVYSKILPW